MYSGFVTLESQVFVAIIIANIVMGIMVWLYAARGSISRYVFLFFIAAQILWLTTNYLLFAGGEKHFLFLTRLTVFFATFHAFFFFLFVYTYLEQAQILKQKFVIASSVFGAFAALLTLSPYVFSHYLVDASGQLVPQPGPAIPVFGLFVGLCVLTSFYTLFKKFRTADGVKKKLFKYLSAGVVLTFVLILAFSFLNVVFFDNISTVRFGHIYTLPFMLMTGYVMIRHGFLNLKPILAEAAIIFLVFILTFRLLSSYERNDFVINLLTLAGAVIMGIFVIRSVKEEIHQREKIGALAEQLSGANIDLERSNERLRIIDQRKSEFVTIVSHQLRTPITAIKGYTSLILENSFGPISDTVRPPIEKIYVSSKRLAEMVTDFLNISKIEQGTMTYVLKPVDVGAMIIDLADDFTQMAHMKKIELRMHIPKDNKFIAVADEGKLRQIFSNLIDNSIKYTPTGSVDISIEEDSSQNHILIKLKDTGIGLSQDDIHHLFGKFTRGIDGQRQNTEGSGLGLYVAKKMLEAQGGDVFVDSEGPGKGSTFAIELKSSDEFQ